MTESIQAALFAGNQGVSVKSDYGLWGTTTRKMKFRISSACAEIDKDQSIVRVPIQFTNMPNVKRATLVPETFSLSLNADVARVQSNPPILTDTGIVPNNVWGLTNPIPGPTPYSQVCLRCRQLSQPNSFDNGAVVNGILGNLPANTITDHAGFQGNSNIIMSMPCLSGHGQDDGADRLVQTYRNYSGNEYDCGTEIQNNCFQVDSWEFGLTNEWGEYYNLKGNDNNIRHSWYAEFSIVYEPEKTEFDLN